MNVNEALDIADDGIHDNPAEIDTALLVLAHEVWRLRPIEERAQLAARGNGFGGLDEVATARYILTGESGAAAS